ncbi:MAG: hypothetical protein JXR64_03330, partial [Spirochaetales bacterium]|nr:hypothetical protein [Spirochaetales bacterium]
MNRDLYHPLVLGAMTIILVMAFKFIIPLNILLTIFSYSVVVSKLNKSVYSKYLIIIVSSLIIASLGVSRAEIILNSNDIPINTKHFVADCIVISDSTPGTFGYSCKGQIILIKSANITAKVRVPVNIYSLKPLFKGANINNCSVDRNNYGFSIFIDNDCSVLYKTLFSKTRINILS